MAISENPFAPTVVISNISPLVEGGRFATKRIEGELVRVEADIFKDGHDEIRAKFLWKKIEKGSPLGWSETPMSPVDNDRWATELRFEEPGLYECKILAWADAFSTWIHDFERRLTGDQEDFATDIEEGRIILEQSAERASSSRKDVKAIKELEKELSKADPDDIPELFESSDTRDILYRHADLSQATENEEPFRFMVEEKLAAFSAWYEFFPRSAKGKENEHSTFRDCLPRLEDAKKMGFDIVYFPPIHPIGHTARKGKNNTLTAKKDDVGSPWAIGAKSGGHRSVEPLLGDLDDFEQLVIDARDIGIEIALDFAINCSPDHPYVKDHPEWFFQRPDGTIKYAENPPKKYQDIYPINFHCEGWEELWEELLDVVLFWVGKGVRIFRVDNPHTKPVSFWEWLIARVQEVAPGTMFLSEAFTRPRMMEMLGKIGFTQSYTYFTWRQTKEEIIEYVEELTKGEMRNYYRANFWPNTPDILPYHLQNKGPAAFKIRAALAATLSTSWGMYSGYEFCESEPLEGREEYLDSEKFQLKERDWNATGIKPFITRLNQVRQAEAAFQEYANIEFIDSDSNQVLAYYRWSDSDPESRIIVTVNLDANYKQDSHIHLPLEKLGIEEGQEFQVTDLLYGESYLWRDSTNFVSLDPRTKPVHILKVTVS